MDTLKWGGISQRRLMENITLLWILNELPERPAERQLMNETYPNRSLTTSREKEIVDNLAFLSSTTDDSLKVMAVCVEEKNDHEGLIIRLASNTGNIKDIRVGFQKLAGVLEIAATRVNSKFADIQSLLRLVVTLDYWRILSRLRSKHAKITKKTKDKPPLIKLLATTIYDKSIRASGTVTQNKLVDIRAKVDDLNILFDKFENTTDHRAESLEIQDMSMKLIRQANELASMPELHDALGSSQFLDPGLKTFLPEAVGKFGRYYGATHDLVCAARHKGYRLFKQVAVEIVSFPEHTIAKGPITNSTLIDSAQHVIRPKGHQEQMALRRSIETYLDKPLAEIEQKFRSRIVQTRDVKIHAEIQLLFYYELNPGCLRPRVICSSKNACYLCDLFIRLHSRVVMMRTHGRIYDKWILPDFKQDIPSQRQHELNIVVKQFNAALEQKIKMTLSSRRIPYNHPNESVLIPNAHWSPSTTSVASRQQPLEAMATPHLSNIGISNVEQHILAPPASAASSKTTSAKNSNSTIGSSDIVAKDDALTAGSSPEMVNHSGHPLAERIHIVSKSSSVESQPTRDSSIIYAHNHASECAPPIYELMNQGQSIRRQLLHPVQLVRVRIYSMHLDLSRETTLTDDVVTSQECWVEVKWLDSYEKSRISDTQHVFHIRDMSDCLPITANHGSARTPTGLYLQVGREVVYIKYSYNDSPEQDI